MKPMLINKAYNKIYNYGQLDRGGTTLAHKTTVNLRVSLMSALPEAP